MKADALLLGVGAAAALLGAALFVAPAPSHGASTPPLMIDERASVSLAYETAERLTALFDLSRLPAPVAAPAREGEADPAAALRRYAYAGGAESSGRGRALFEKDGAVTALAPGEDLEGFTLVAFDAGAAHFERDGVAVSLPIRE